MHDNNNNNINNNYIKLILDCGHLFIAYTAILLSCMYCYQVLIHV